LPTDLRTAAALEADLIREQQGQRRFGTDTVQARADLQNEVAAAGESEFARGFRDDTLAGALITAWNRPEFADDPEFSPFDREEVDQVPFHVRQRLLNTTSDLEFDTYLSEHEEQLAGMRRTQASGATGQLARVLGSMLDVDLPLAAVPVGGQIYKGGRLARMLKSGAAAGAGSLVIETANVAVRGSNEWADVPMAGAFGFLLGTGGGALSRRIDSPDRSDFNTQRTAEAVIDEFGEYGERTDNWTTPPVKETYEPDIGDDFEYVRTDEDGVEIVDSSTVEGLDEVLDDLEARDPSQVRLDKDSAGAARNPETLAFDEAVESLNPEVSETIKNAQSWQAGQRIDARKNQDESQTGTPVQQGIASVGDKLVQNPWLQKLIPDFQRLINHPGAVMQRLAYDLLESPSGFLRNHRTAALQRDFYHGRVMSEASDVEHQYVAFSRSRDRKMADIYLNDTNRDEFYKSVIMELNARRLAGSRPAASVARKPDDHVALAADAIERGNEVGFEIGRGRNGERPIDGFKDLEKKPGYFPQIWKPAKLSAAVASHGRAKVVKVLSKAYVSANPGMSPEVARKIAKAVERRMHTRMTEADTTAVNLLDSDGRQFLEMILRDSGSSEADIRAVMDQAFGAVEERGQASFVKSRVEIDMSVEEDGLKIIDLFETDINLAYGRYARQLSGRAAMARKGLGNEARRKTVLEAALQEQEVLINLGKLDPKMRVSRDEMEGIFSYFQGQPISGGVDPAVRRAKQVADLVLLNQLGLTQMAEMGRQVWAVGIRNFFETSHVTDELLRALRPSKFGRDGADQRSHPLLKEIEPWAGRIGEDHVIFRDEYMLDEARDPRHQSPWTAVDSGLRKARRLQGWTSGFFQARQFQHRLAVITMANKLARTMTGRLETGDLAISANRLAASGDSLQSFAEKQMKDLGLTGKTGDRVKASMLKHAEFLDNGTLDKLHIDQWGDIAREDFILALNRSAAQSVQRALIGEEPIWLSTTLGSVFGHLKRFPMLALSKQIGNGSRVAGAHNEQMISLVALTMGSAGLAFIAKEWANNALTPDQAFNEGFWFEVGRGALNYSNITGAVAGNFDPVMTMLGLEDYRMYNYGPPSRAGVLSFPTVDALNKVLKLPGPLIAGVNPFQDMERGDVAALKGLPLIGNAYGASAAFNWTKEQL